MAKFSDYEMISEFGIVEKNIILFKVCRVIRIIVIRIIPDNDIRGCDNILDKTGSFIFVRKNLIRFGIFFID